VKWAIRKNDYATWPPASAICASAWPCSRNALASGVA
jgi:hypothetical protein